MTDPEQETSTESIYMRFGAVEFNYEGDDLEGAWESAKAGIDAYLEARDDGE